MSEIINNREYRQKILKEIITELHSGRKVDDVKPRFEKLIEGIAPSEISEMEQALIMDGMPVEEIQRLCDVHAAVFKGSIEEIHKPADPSEIPGHPVHTFKLENREIEKLVDKGIRPKLEALKTGGPQSDLQTLREEWQRLWEIDRHYLRKENQLFPFLEKYGITAPPKVMWGVDDEIRDELKEIRRMLEGGTSGRIPGESLPAGAQIAEAAANAVNRVIDMIFKEESILFPMALDTLSEDEWVKIANDSDETGYCLITPKKLWKPSRVNLKEKESQKGEEPGTKSWLNFESGMLDPAEIEAMLNTMPFDITFVDKDGAVKYFSQGKERIFVRTRTVLGRQVQNCHPPASVHIVEKVVEDLKAGRKDHEDFWIHIGDRYVFIRYFAVRDKKGEFLGIMEVTQDIGPIQHITGEKRLL